MNRYVRGAALLGCYAERSPSVLGDDGGKIPTGLWVVFGLAIAGLTTAAVYQTKKG